MKDMNRIRRILFLYMACACSVFTSCDYLNVVPDAEMSLDDIYRSRLSALQGLAKMYTYLPEDHITHNSTWLLGDEFVGRPDMIGNNQLRGTRIMRGFQSPSNSQTQLGLWSGVGGSKCMYEGIRTCNIFLSYLDGIPDIGDVEREEWRAQAKFLIGYFHFLLLRQYGPVIITETVVPLDAVKDDLFLRRAKVEECFDFILRMIDESIPYLKEEVERSEWGTVDRAAAMAIKARVLLYRASPFFSGNKAYYSNFLDFDGQPYFSMDDSEETRMAKWKAAADAADAAIKYCLSRGKKLYRYEKPPRLYDEEEFGLNEERIRTHYSLREVVTDPWNSELIWGYSNTNWTGGQGGMGDFQELCQMRIPPGNFMGSVYAESQTAFAHNWLSASYNVAARYYTERGLPIDEDLYFDTPSMFDITLTPDESTIGEWRGILQPGKPTIGFYLNREPRFYANLAVTSGYWRTYFLRIPTDMYADGVGGYSGAFPYEYYSSGIGIKKFVHPESQCQWWQRIVRYPYPIIRLADLYLMKAEALNEYSGPVQEVLEAINEVRLRAGIPTVENAWAIAKNTPNKHTAKDGMRDIILQERGIELAFEGSRFWDMLRHLRCEDEFNNPILGWDSKGTSVESFFMLEPKQVRQFSTRDYLWPVDLNELNTNGNLKQNPSWE